LLSKNQCCDVNFTQSISQQQSEVLQIRTDAQQKLLHEVIIPHSSAVWHKNTSCCTKQTQIYLIQLFKAW